MVEFMKELADGVEFAGFFLYVIIFYFSLKKCFWKGEKKKISLILLALFTNPFICFVELLIVTVIGLQVLVNMGIVSYNTQLSAWEDGMMWLPIGLLYLPLVLVYASLACRFFGKKNKEMIYYVYLVFGVIMMLMAREDGITFAYYPIAGTLVRIVSMLIMLIAVLLFYFVLIRSLAKLVDSPYTTNARVFLAPPILFLLLYSPTSMMVSDLFEMGAVLILYVFSTLLLYIFLWASYLIINNLRATAEVKTLSVEVMEALAHTIDAKDEYTKGHSVRVAKYSRLLARKLGMSPADCDNVYYMGLLHDIGKIGVPNSIINSTTRLTDDEFAVIKTHPGLGYEILAEIKSRPDLSIGAKWHHERYDGKGYPEGKAGLDIPLPARIIAVADSYDAMTSNRSYRKYMPQEKVREEIQKNAGTQFDPEIARAMVEIIDEDKEYVMHE